VIRRWCLGLVVLLGLGWGLGVLVVVVVIGGSLLGDWRGRRIVLGLLEGLVWRCLEARLMLLLAVGVLVLRDTTVSLGRARSIAVSTAKTTRRRRLVVLCVRIVRSHHSKQVTEALFDALSNTKT